MTFKHRKSLHYLTSTLGNVATSMVFKCSLVKPYPKPSSLTTQASPKEKSQAITLHRLGMI
jgi:hypothetical protein